MSKVTEKNTKKEIMDYVKELEKKLAEKSDARKTTDDIKKEAKVKEIKESAQKLIATGIVNEKTEAQYNDLLETIKLLDKELKEVYDIQRNVHTLEALIITYQDKNESLLREFNAKSLELQGEFESKKAKWDADLKQCQADHDKLVKDLKAVYAEEKAKLDKERAREKEEYAYNLKRERAIEDDRWADKKAVREKELSSRIAAVAEREESMEALEKKVAAFEARIAELESERQGLYDKGVEDGKAKAKKDAETSKVFSDRAHKAELDRKDDKIAALESSLAETRKANESLQTKLDEAYSRIQSMAIEAAKNSGVRMVENTSK